MEIRKIKAQTVCDTVKKLFTDCNYFIGKDIMSALETARDNESSPVGKSVLSQIIENDKIAAREEVPLCQDTGMAVLFVEYGDRVVIEDGSFDEAVNEGVRRAYIDGYLRKSVVNDPVFDRINTKDNTPAIIHTKIVSGNQIKITAGGKGFGSENMSQIKMLTPSKGIEGVKQFILDTVFRQVQIPVRLWLSVSESAVLLKEPPSLQKKRPSVRLIPKMKMNAMHSLRTSSLPKSINGIRSCRTWRQYNRNRREYRNFTHTHCGNACCGQHLLPCRKTRKCNDLRRKSCGKENYTSDYGRRYQKS